MNSHGLPAGDEIALVVARTQKPEDSLLLSLVVVNRSTGEVARTLSTNAHRFQDCLDGLPTAARSHSWKARRRKSLLRGWPLLQLRGGPVRPLMKDYSGTVLLQNGRLIPSISWPKVSKARGRLS